jgi:LssY C-terminus
MPIRSVVAFLSFITICAAAPVPSGTTFVIRIDASLSSHLSQPGDHVSGILVQTIPSSTAVPLGSRFDGTVVDARRKGHRDDRAMLSIDFDFLAHGDAQIPVSTRVQSVDNARETVDPDGVIRGVRPMKSRPTKLESALMLAAYSHPIALLTYGIAKVVWVNARHRPGINFPSGTELSLVVEEAFEAPATLKSDSILRHTNNEFEPVHERTMLVERQPLRVTTPKAELSDLTNILLAGTEEQIVSVFSGAGWVHAEPLSFRTKTKMFLAMIRRKAYATGPVAPLLLEDRAPDLVFQKQLNTFAMRHHIRIWRMPETLEGAPVWLATATHDISIRFSPWTRIINHKVESDLDVEREKVVADLQFQGRVSSLSYVARPSAPQSLINATGDRLTTDGQIALMVLR